MESKECKEFDTEGYQKYIAESLSEWVSDNSSHIGKDCLSDDPLVVLEFILNEIKENMDTSSLLCFGEFVEETYERKREEELYYIHKAKEDG